MSDPLASPSDLEAHLGRDLTDAEATRAKALLAGASAIVRGFTRRTFTLVEDDEVVLPKQGDRIRLPQPPVLSVASVVAVGGGTGLPDLPLLDWQWDGIDTIRVGSGACVINLPEAWHDDQDGYPGTFRVVYTHGDTEVPDDVVLVVVSAVLRVLANPASLRSETVGSYSVTYAVPATGEQLGLNLTRYEKEVLGRYRRTASTIKVI